MDNTSLQMELKSSSIWLLYTRNSIFATEYRLKGWGSFRKRWSQLLHMLHWT